MIVSCSAGVTVFSAALRRIVSQKVLAVSASVHRRAHRLERRAVLLAEVVVRRGELVSERVTRRTTA